MGLGVGGYPEVFSVFWKIDQKNRYFRKSAPTQGFKKRRSRPEPFTNISECIEIRGTHYLRMGDGGNFGAFTKNPSCHAGPRLHFLKGPGAGQALGGLKFIGGSWDLRSIAKEPPGREIKR